MTTLLVMAGGTGGHVYPALAVADYLRENGIKVVWLGTRSGLEARVAPNSGFDIRWMNVSGLRGKGLKRYLSMPFILLRAIVQGLKIVRDVQPDAILGMGGFASGPGAVSGWILRKPLLIHEANASAGLTNRLLAPFARRIMCGFPGTRGLPDRAEWTGNPIRTQIQPCNAGSERDSVLHLLVVGGSQGARVFNRNLPEFLSDLIARQKISVWHQCGRAQRGVVSDSYQKHGVDVRVDEFIDHMGDAYCWSDLVLCRAGAMTVAELCVAGVASVLVPFPFAAGDHQTANARFLTRHGAATLVEESRFDKATIDRLLTDLGEDRSRVRMMGERARDLARTDATDTVGKVCMEVMHA